MIAFSEIRFFRAPTIDAICYASLSTVAVRQLEEMLLVNERQSNYTNIRNLVETFTELVMTFLDLRNMPFFQGQG